METPIMEQVTPELRRSQVLRGTHNGRAIEYRVCEELLDGRWEGFVSIVRYGAQQRAEQ